MVTELTTLPVRLRVHLAHATVQAIADEARADVLHIKGPATEPALRPESRTSADADVIVRPSHLKRLLRGLKRHGWVKVTSLRSGGLVEHSTNWYHAQLGQLDVHIRFPGIQIEGERAFDELWRDVSTQEIAHLRCRVPSSSAQRLLLLLHAARDVRRRASDIRVAWDEATDAQRSRVESLARDLRAEVALATATGRLEEYRDNREHALWHNFANRSADDVELWTFFMRAAPDGIRLSRWRSARYVSSVIFFLPTRLRRQVGRPLRATEITHAYWQLAQAALRSLGRTTRLRR